MDGEHAARKVLDLLKNRKTESCARCIAEAAELEEGQVKPILDVLVGTGRAERIGSKVGETVIAMGCWQCGAYDVTYRYALRLRDLLNPKHW